ncbi:MAG: hypothetical protein IJY08_04135 [Clostridia bacterium]|nr:hypothetical protein [Clostridia bacterium]
MLKGINRNVIVVRTDRKSRFEAVYFVLKKGGAADKADMVKEANRIISESGMTDRPRRRKVKTALCLICAALLGASAGVGACLVLFL